jgi:hypothetical protein
MICAIYFLSNHSNVFARKVRSDALQQQPWKTPHMCIPGTILSICRLKVLKMSSDNFWMPIRLEYRHGLPLW